MKFIPNIIVSALIALTVSYCTVATRAQDMQPHKFSALVCDTPAQVADYITRQKDAFNPPGPAAGPNCAAGVFLGVDADLGPTAADGTGQEWQLVHVVIIGVDTKRGFQPVDPPKDAWTAYQIKKPGRPI